jgi:hypothetical protein
MSLTLGKFRELTAKLSDDAELLCAGAPVEFVYHTDDAVSIDDDRSFYLASEMPEATVLYGDDD